MNFQAGDILFVKGDFLTSPIIKGFLKSEYSHVAVAVGSEYICEVDYKKIEIIKNPYQPSEYDLYRMKTGLTPEQQEKFVEFLHHRCSTAQGYDWWRILSLAIQKYLRFHLIVHEPNHYICSEIIDKAYQHIGIDLVENRVTGDVSPVNLLLSKKLNRVATGSQAFNSTVNQL